MVAVTAPSPGIRIDKLLWFLRLAGSRAAAQAWAGAGHIRLNGRRVERASATVRPGDVLVLPRSDNVEVIEIMAIPLRRGPAPEARECYRTIDRPGNAARDGEPAPR
jgi:ribosome-associated heat shock protein Hsp15